MVENALGYLSEEYARSLSEFGTPRYLPRSRGWLLERSIPGTPYKDAMGLYPLFCCENPDGLRDDFGELPNLVSVVVVVDPMQSTAIDAFDRYRLFKTHYIVSQQEEYKPSNHHIRYAKKALRDGVQVNRLDDPITGLAAWCNLYNNLIERHSITGIQAFSPKSFRIQFSVPGLNAFVARYNSDVISMLLTLEHKGAVYYHLGASSDLGYEMKASFALMDFAIRFFRPKTFVLGGASGNADSNDGLASFKAGWANFTTHSYLCEAILRPYAYNKLVTDESDYYPAYRG